MTAHAIDAGGDTLLDAAHQALMPLSQRPPVVFLRGDGDWVWDHNDRPYLDFVQGWAVNTFGHCAPVVQRALAAQASRLISPGPGFHNEPSVHLARLLTRHSAFDQVFFASSGAEATEGAIKLVRKWGGRWRDGAHEIITFEHAFHGRTLAAMSASGKPRFRDLFEPKVPGFPKARLNDITSVARLITPRTAAIMVEPIQGEAGVHVAERGFLRELRQLATDARILLVVDEIQTGMGRTGTLWAHEHAGIEPDVMTLGKMLGAGVPLSAVLARAHVACFEPGDHGGTLSGNPLMTAVGHAVLQAVLAPGFVDAVTERGHQLRTALEHLSTRLGLGGVRGRGLLLGLEVGGSDAPAVEAAARSEGLLINAPQPDVVRLVPALNVAPTSIDTMAERLERAVTRARSRRPETAN